VSNVVGFCVLNVVVVRTFVIRVVAYAVLNAVNVERIVWKFVANDDAVRMFVRNAVLKIVL